MSDGGRTAQVSGDSPAGSQSNWPTTGAAGVVVGGLVVGGLVVDVAAGKVVGVVEVEDAAMDDVEMDDAMAVVGGMLDVGVGAAVSSADSVAGADDSVRVVQPTAARPSESNTDVTVAVRRPPTNSRDPIRTVCPPSLRRARHDTTLPLT
jgi:hypothetical protein